MYAKEHKFARARDMSQATIIIGMAALIEMIAGVAVLVGQVPPDAITALNIHQTVIYDNARLMAFCAMGSIAGAFLSIAALPNPEILHSKNAIRLLCVKFVASLVGGMIGAPMAIRYLEWETNVDTVLFVSGMVAVSAVSTIQVLIPWFIDFVKSKVKGPTG